MPAGIRFRSLKKTPGSPSITCTGLEPAAKAERKKSETGLGSGGINPKLVTGSWRLEEVVRGVSNYLQDVKSEYRTFPLFLPLGDPTAV